MFRTIFDKVQSCVLKCSLIKNLNLNMVPRIFTSHLGFEVEVDVGVWSWRWRWRLSLKMKLAFDVEVGVGVGVWSWRWRLKLALAFEVEVGVKSWSWRLKLKLAFEVGVALLSCCPYYGCLSIWTFHLILFAKTPPLENFKLPKVQNQLKVQFKYASKCSELSLIKFSPVF